MKKLALLTTLTAGFNLALIGSANSATYGGEATGAIVTVTATGTTIRAASGSISLSGGEADAALSVGDIPGSATGGVVSLAAKAMSSVVIGTGPDTRAHGAMGAVGLTVSGNQISTDFLMARSKASCGPTVAGTSELDNLVINGQPVTVTGEPNQTIALPNGTVTINQQVQTVGGTSGELTVKALRVVTNDAVTGQPVADVALGTAVARIDCAGGSSPGEQWVSGGGWIPSINTPGAKATFGFVAGPSGQQLRGHLTLHDQGSGQTIHGTVITQMTNCFGTGGTSSFDGTYPQGTFHVDTNDLSEPGTTDTFVIDATTYPANGGVIGGGNIQTHGFNCH
jgi:hypothetical protein